MTPSDLKKLYNYLYKDGATPDFVYEDFMSEMPYGTAKARDGDPDNWLSDNFDMVKEFYENEYDFTDIISDELKEKNDNALEAEATGN